MPAPEPITSYVLLRVKHRYPIPGGAGEECARRIWAKDEVVRVDCLVDTELLADMVAKIQDLE